MLGEGRSLCFHSLQEFDVGFAGKHSEGSASFSAELCFIPSSSQVMLCLLWLLCGTLRDLQQRGDAALSQKGTEYKYMNILNMVILTQRCRIHLQQQ